MKSLLKFLQNGYVTGPLIGALWAILMAITVAVMMSFATGEAFRPSLFSAIIIGAVWVVAIQQRLPKWTAVAIGTAAFAGLSLISFGGIAFGDHVGAMLRFVSGGVLGFLVALPLTKMLEECRAGEISRHDFEESVIRFLSGVGYVIFTALVVIPFYIMVMTSLKTQGELLANPLDFSLDFSKGADLFRSYVELFRDNNFGQYLWTSFYVSILTVFITLLFSVPGAYAVARLRFRGQAVMSRSILLIYMVPMIVLALPIYIAFSMTGLRNSIVGIVMIYPVTTIPVALYMLQGYFRGLPAEVEEAGLMDGLSRLKVIWKITLPLSLPALASVSLYVFMIAWNEFLLAFMLLDDPAKFTLTRGVAMLNSSEVPRQQLMAGAVIATVPIMILFLSLEKFMTKGLTAGSVKG